MFTLGVLEFVLGGFFFYFLGKRCQNHNKEYIELDENQYDSIKNFITAPIIPPRYDESETIQNDLTRYNVSTTQNTTNEVYQQPLSPPPEFTNDNNIELIRHNEVFIIMKKKKIKKPKIYFKLFQIIFYFFFDNLFHLIF